MKMRPRRTPGFAAEADDVSGMDANTWLDSDFDALKVQVPGDQIVVGVTRVMATRPDPDEVDVVEAFVRARPVGVARAVASADFLHDPVEACDNWRANSGGMISPVVEPETTEVPGSIPGTDRPGGTNMATRAIISLRSLPIHAITVEQAERTVVVET